VIYGLDAAEAVFEQLDPDADFERLAREGSGVRAVRWRRSTARPERC